MCTLLALLQGNIQSLFLCESFPHGTGFLRSQIQGFVLFRFVELAQVLSLGLRDDCQNTGNVFTNQLAKT